MYLDESFVFIISSIKLQTITKSTYLIRSVEFSHSYTIEMDCTQRNDYVIKKSKSHFRAVSLPDIIYINTSTQHHHRTFPS